MGEINKKYYDDDDDDDEEEAGETMLTVIQNPFVLLHCAIRMKGAFQSVKRKVIPQRDSQEHWLSWA